MSSWRGKSHQFAADVADQFLEFRAGLHIDRARSGEGDVIALVDAAGRVALKGVDKIFQAESGPVTALKDIDLEIAPGRFVVLLGPSGCGKTTLLRLIGGLERESAGTLTVESGGRSGTGVAVAFQDPRLFPWFSVEENIALPLRLKGVGKAERLAKARALCELVGLQGFEKASPNALSGGMRQRAAIARALSCLLYTSPSPRD